MAPRPAGAGLLPVCVSCLPSDVFVDVCQVFAQHLSGCIWSLSAVQENLLGTPLGCIQRDGFSPPWAVYWVNAVPQNHFQDIVDWFSRRKDCPSSKEGVHAGELTDAGGSGWSERVQRAQRLEVGYYYFSC